MKRIGVDKEDQGNDFLEDIWVIPAEQCEPPKEVKEDAGNDQAGR